MGQTPMAPHGEGVRETERLGAQASRGIEKGEVLMKQHKFWAFAAIACMVMCVITGKKRV